MHLIVGLGNPGTEYQYTRHNVGFLAVDAIHSTGDFEAWKENKKMHGLIAQGTWGDKKIVLLKPTTFMNLSGESVAATLLWKKIPPTNLIVLHDDIDIPFGENKIQPDRGAAGHNGIKSIIESLGTKNFTRVRVGIHPTNTDKKIHAGNVVLQKFSKEELEILSKTFFIIKEKVSLLISI